MRAPRRRPLPCLWPLILIVAAAPSLVEARRTVPAWLRDVANAVQELNAPGFSSEKLDLHSLGISDAQINSVMRLLMDGSLDPLEYGDLNHDGVVDIRDLPEILGALDGFSINDIPEPWRSMLLGSLDTNHDGAINAADVQPIIDILSRTPGGEAVLSALRSAQADGQLNPRQLMRTYADLAQLATQMAPTNGHLDLSRLRPEVRQALLAHFDADHNGYLTPEDVQPLLNGLLDTNHDGSIDRADLQPLIDLLGTTPAGERFLASLRNPQATMEHLGFDPSQLTTDGHLNLDPPFPPVARQMLLARYDADGDRELTPADVRPLFAALRQSMSQSPPPPQPSRPPQSPPSMPPKAPPGQGISGGSVVLILFLLAALGALGWLGWRRWSKRQASDTRPMLSSIAGISTAAYPESNYNAPIPTPMVTASPLTSDGVMGTRNADALSRARVANAGVPPV